MNTEELIRRFGDDMEKFTLERVNLALDTVRYRRHNPTRDCMCDICRTIYEIKKELNKLKKN